MIEDYTLDNVIAFLESRVAELDRQYMRITNRYEEAKDLLEHFKMMKKNVGSKEKEK